MRYSFVLAAALAASGFTASPSSLPAQDRNQDDSDRIEADRFEQRVEPDRLMRVIMNRRARLGIKVNLQARESDSLGAYVESVTPNGPAAKAGLRSGDVITKVDGKSVLSGARRESEGSDRQSLPGLRLIELAARLQPDDTVPVEYLRGKDRRTATVITEDEPDVFFEAPPMTMRYFRPFDHDMRMPAAGHMDMDMDMGPGGRFEFLAGSPLGDLELAPLNPDLGQYFGTTDGVLVIRAPKDGSLGLKGGDVVQAVDGRKPAGPSHLMRILRSYDRGETFKLDILRNKKRETVTGRLGDRER
jgi:hypothetical protein